jgi:HAD superfamily hydrolase (TIGR01509 family)
VKLVLFDLDGTLVDTAPAVRAAVDRVRARAGLAAVSEAAVRAVLSDPAAQGGETSLLVPAGAGGKERRDALVLFGRYLQEAFQQQTRVYPGVPGLLEALAARGVRTALVSNRLTLFLHEILHHAGLAGRFELVLGADAVALPPPAPDVVRQVLAQTEVEAAEALLVADGAPELEAARAAGVATAYAAYGYGCPPAWSPGLVLEAPGALLDHV